MVLADRSGWPGYPGGIGLEELEGPASVPLAGPCLTGGFGCYF